jgi:hypothetical protein
MAGGLQIRLNVWAEKPFEKSFKNICFICSAADYQWIRG